jgi:hypothetical protein
MAEILNQFTYTDVKGKVVNGDKGLAFGCKLYGAINAGDFVKRKAVAGSKVIVVEAIAADTDEVFGVIPYESAKKNVYVSGDMVTVQHDYTRIVCTASGAITAIQTVMPVVSGMKVAAQTVGKTIVGIALQPAADGELVEVLVKTVVKAST